MKYIAIKVEGIAHWFWFEKSKCKEENFKFEGKDGWGKGGAQTNLYISTSSIVGRIESANLQYTPGS